MMRTSTLIKLVISLLPTMLVVSVWVSPALAQECCTPCHGNVTDVHGDFDHTAVLASGPVLIFADTDHDDAGHTGPKPYFDVTVNCGLCHITALPAIHGDDCATCHPTPYNTVENVWQKGCQQGGCHATFHEASTTAHLPFEDPYDPQNNCNRCHDPSFNVTQNACQNCHTTTGGPVDTSPPVTTSNALGVYNGPATIDFSITDNGKVGVGRTFYRLDGGPVTAAGKYVTVTDFGEHTLEFWSKDQYGNTETPANMVGFTIEEDTTPPTTTSDALVSYAQGAVINLTATDASTLGVKATYYRLNAGPTQTGTRIVIPATPGTLSYTLAFWSEDYAGNIEAENSVSFTVTSGGGIFRLIWGNSDVSGSPCPDAEAHWTVVRGANTVVASGSGICPWDGVDDVPVQVSEIPYTVVIDWWNPDFEDFDQSRFEGILVTTPGQIIELRY